MSRPKRKPGTPEILAVTPPLSVREPSTAAALAFLAAEEHVHGRVATAPSEVVQCLRAAYAVDFPAPREEDGT